MVAKRMWQVSLVVMLVISAFWVIWYLIAGSVPQTTAIRMSKDWQIVLPFAISRWWDIAFAGIWAAIIVFIFSGKTIIKESLGIGLAFFLTLGMAMGLIIGSIIGLVFSLTVGLSVSLVVGLIISLIIVTSPVFGMVFGLGVILGLSLGIGLIFSLGMGLIIFLILVLVVGPLSCLKLLL